MAHSPKLAALALVGVLGALTARAAAQSPAAMLKVEGDRQAGHATLRWSCSGSETAEFQVQESRNPGFEQQAELLYQGGQLSSVLSGLANGTSYYRVRCRGSAEADWGSWSDPAAFEVEHYSPRFAGTLFGLGAIVFVCTAGFLLTMSRRSSDV
jgi:hypothetical protein